MNNQQIVLDINQIKPEALNVFYGHVLKQCSLAMEDESLMKEYESYKKTISKGGEKKNRKPDKEKIDLAESIQRN